MSDLPDPTLARYRTDGTEIAWETLAKSIDELDDEAPGLDAIEETIRDLSDRTGIEVPGLKFARHEPPMEMANRLFAQAKFFLVQGGSYLTMLWEHGIEHEWRFRYPVFDDRAAKYRFAHGLARRAKQMPIDAFLLVSEEWLLPQTDLGNGTYPPDFGSHPNRLEALSVTGIGRDGTRVWLSCMFSRDQDGQIVLGDDISDLASVNSDGFWRPVAVAWGLDALSDPSPEADRVAESPLWKSAPDVD